MKKSMVTFLKHSSPLIIALVFFVAVSVCQSQEGIIEKAGKKIDEGVAAVKDTAVKPEDKAKEGAEAAKDTAVKPEEKAKEGAEAAKDTAAKAGDKIGEGVGAAKDALGVPAQKTGEQAQFLLGYYKGEASGKMDKDTREAVKEF